MRKIEQAIAIQAPKAEVFAVLREYDRYGYWMPGIISSKGLAEEGNIRVVEFLYRYSGSKDHRCTLEIVDNGLDRVQYGPAERAEYEQAPSSSPTGIRGEWELREGPSSDEVLLIGRIFAVRGGSFLFKIGARRVLSRFLTAVLHAAKDRVMFRRSSDEALLDWSDVEEEGEKILRMIQDEDGGLWMWFRGRKYELRPVD